MSGDLAEANQHYRWLRTMLTRLQDWTGIKTTAGVAATAV
jgi:hypothetical protein